MSVDRPARCVCAAKKVNGLCPHGCERFRRPSWTDARRKIEARRREREAQAMPISRRDIRRSGWLS